MAQLAQRIADYGGRIGSLAIRFAPALSRLPTVVLVLCLAAGPLAALEIEFSGRAVKRDILALYDSRHEAEPYLTRIHRFAEMPLNHLGYRLAFADVNQPLPDPARLQRYKGIVTWFLEPTARPGAVAAWLDAATGSGLRLAVLGSIAPPESAANLPVVNNVLARIGLKHTGGYVNLTFEAKVVINDKAVIGFERPVDKVLPAFPVVVAHSDQARVHLSIKAPLDDGEQTAVVVATSDHGGYAAQNFTYAYEPNTNRVGWILNPFKFFKAAFGGARFPIPDTTTLAGNRIYFCHIDGDGWNNLSEIETYRLAQALSVEVIAREAIEPYRDLPVSVGLIAGDIDISMGGNPRGAVWARHLFALPQVEVASHTHTHPYDWQFFRNYSRALEEKKRKIYKRPVAPLRQRFTAAMLRMAKKNVPADQFNPYVAGTDDLPRTYLKRPFNLKHEVEEALQISSILAPLGKPAKLYQWSGDTTPFPKAIEATRKAGIRNINGGDSRLDSEYPSIAYVPAISRSTGGQRQIYAVNSNENTYTNDWTGPYYGFYMLEHTLKNTDAPRRLKPFNLYYHMYSGEKAAALAPVRYFLEMARKSDVIPITTSHYAAIADDYFAADIEQIDLSSWAILNRGAMQTVRFDEAHKIEVDYARSSGVLGANRHQGSLYVALDEAAARAVVTMKPRAAAIDARTALRAATLVSSRWQLSNLVGESCGFSVSAQGFGPGRMVWRTKPGRGFRIVASRGGAVLSEETIWAGKDGLLRLIVTENARDKPLQLRFTCHE